VIDVHRMAGRIWHPSLAAIIEQLRRSTLSVQLNVAEGQALGSGRQFARHLTIAYGSAVESVELLDLLRELVPDYESELKILVDSARRNGFRVLALKRSIVRRPWFNAQEAPER
jgi:four helix bundle protein